MAFKTFAPGVLTSSDVNTFLMRQSVITCTAATRPASPNEGMLIYETDTDLFKVYSGTAWGDMGQFVSGLVHISTNTFSAVSTVSINNCFSALYENYKIIIIADGSASVDLTFRMRVGGVDNSAASYNTQVARFDDTASTFARATGGTSGVLGPLQTSVHIGNLELFRPFSAASTFGTYVAGFGNATPRLEIRHTNHTVSTSFDGITFFPASGNISGSIRVYGYKNI
jgi:hypothetical protein